MADLRKHSSTSNIVRFVLKHATTGQGLTALTYASSGLIISTITDVEASPVVYTVAAGNVEDITTLATFAAPTASKCRFKLVSDTNHKGLYEFQFDNARFSVAGAKRLIISVTGATNLLDADYEIAFNAPTMVAGILDTLLTETGAGYLAAGFKKFFDVATPTSTMNLITAVTTATNLTNLPAKLLRYLQLMVRKDTAIATDNAAELTEINADGGSGAGAYDNQTDANEAIRDRGDAAWITATGFLTDKTGYTLATNGLPAAAVHAAAAAKIADILLRRANASVEASGNGDELSVQSLYALVAMLTNGFDANTTPGTLYIKKADKTSNLGSQTLTGDASANAVVKAVPV